MLDYNQSFQARRREAAEDARWDALVAEAKDIITESIYEHGGRTWKELCFALSLEMDLPLHYITTILAEAINWLTIHSRSDASIPTIRIEALNLEDYCVEAVTTTPIYVMF